MKLFSKLTALALTLALCVSPALAAGVEDSFPAIRDYPGYADVPAGTWYESGAKLCYETGLISGTDKGFEPLRYMQVAEVAAIAARIVEAVTGDAIPAPVPNPALPWYQRYVDYWERHGLSLTEDMEADATRLGFVGLLSAALPDDLLAPINTITALPDSTDSVALQFYNAGILAGTDKYGSFTGDKPLTRAEGAGMVARVIRPALREAVVLADYTPFAAAEVTPGTVFFQSEGIAVTAETYLNAALPAIQALERACKTQGMEFNWFNTETASGLTFLDYVKQTALSAVQVTQAMGTGAYQNFSLQVFYSRYLDLKGTAA